MSGKVFFDKNVLIYAVLSDEPKAAVAQQLLAAGGSISVQVLNEFASVARRKLRWDWAAIQQAIQAMLDLCDPPVPISLATHLAALALADEHHLSFYDAMIVAAALELGCEVLYSEDMQDGQQLGGLIVRNPFA
jgi:predicted nucleic acid-binding protein